MTGNKLVKILFVERISMLATMKTTDDRVRGIDFEKGGQLPTSGYCVCPCVRVCALAVGCRQSPVHRVYYIILYANNWHSGGGAA
jgi:hypothetical protein